jgi:hypothetical protein
MAADVTVRCTVSDAERTRRLAKVVRLLGLDRALGPSNREAGPPSKDAGSRSASYSREGFDVSIPTS